MEAAAAEAAGSIAASRHEQQQQQQVANTALPVLDVVRALHQTVVSLRTKLDQSRAELQRLKESTEESEQQQGGPDYSGDKSSAYSETVGRLALENHVLRRRLIERAGEFSSDASTSPPPPSQAATLASDKQLPEEPATMEATETNEPEPTEPQVAGDEESTDAAATSAPDAPTTPTTPSGQDEVDAGTAAATSKPADEVDEEEEEEEEEEQSNPGANNEAAPERQPAANKLSSQGVSNESENESEELDDIQLIFTTEETCRDVGLQEDLVSITDTENWQAHQARTPTPNDQHKSALKIGQAKSADGEPSMSHVCNGRGGNAGMATGEKASSVDEAASSQSSSIDREESVDRFDESSSSRLNKVWSQCSVLVETDISKCGVLEEADISARHNVARRNTLAAPPAAYRPIIHREALAAGRRKSAAPLRPVMDRAGPGGGRRESGAQTDISALPAQWRSESYLAHKVAHTFTTLPSKFALPAGVAGRLRLSDKTREARRVMLSDISFTSMVPELSRSADHLCHDPHSQFPQPHCYSSRGGAGVATCGAGGGGVAGAGLRTPEANRRESWARSGAGLPSPCECRLSTDLYSMRYRGSLSSIPSPAGACGDFGPSRRHSWRPNAAASFDGWRAPAVVPGSREAMMGGSGGGSCGGSGHQLARPTWSSMPSSPTHVQPPSAALVARLSGSPRRRTSSRVTFQECPMMIRGSLPNLRSDPLAENSGESTETESLIDEAEDYLRRSIDSMLTISTATADAVGRHAARRRRARRHSEPDLFREWQAPQDARPYLPKIPRDLKLDHLVKVISPEGRILQGRVRYVGPVAGREDVHVGVELPNDTAGTSDGTFHGRRYFDCEPDRAVFVPFKKVVLAWCTTT